MNSLKELGFKGLKELRDSGLKNLKASELKDLILKPKTADVNIEDMEDLTKSRKEVKKKIKRLLKEKKEIEARIERAQQLETEKIEEISEFPWREEIFPPLPRKVYVKMSRPLEVNNDSFHAAEPGVSEVKAGGLEIVVKGIVEKPEYKNSEDKKSGDIIEKTDNTKETTIISETGEADPKNRAGEQGKDKTFPEKKEKRKNVYPFSAAKLNENIISSGDSSPISRDKKKPESKNNTSESLLENDLIEELLNSDDLNPEGEQSFMRYLDEPEVEELIIDLKNVKALLTREERAG
ncbi:YadA family autotransporter adhesin [Methanosarcina acetivorans]|nr:YadA family autotransporter adhesin [Methanosarcina acetivorans]